MKQIFDNNFVVGEIVNVKHHMGVIVKGFIEEIISAPHKPFNEYHSGRFSIYCFTRNPYDIKYNSEVRPGNFYLGDHIGADLETTGEMITIEKLEEYKKTHFKDAPGFAKDIDIVIANLGRTKGRNQ